MQKQLQQLGLTDKESQVYLTILKHGKISPAGISNLTDIHRTTVYSVAKELLRKKVITHDLAGATTYYIALPPEELSALLETEKQVLESKEETLDKLLPKLNKLPKQPGYSIPKIRFFGEHQLEDFLYKYTLDWRDSMLATDPTWWGFQDHTFVEDDRYRDWIDWAWENLPKPIDLKLLSNDSAIEKKMEGRHNRRRIKFWKTKPKLNFTASQWVVGDYVIMIMTKQRPHYLVEIRDAVYAENLRELFRHLWQEVE